MLLYLPQECQKLYSDRLTDPIYEKAKKESVEFRNFQEQISKLEVITYDSNDGYNDTIKFDYEKRMSIYGDKITCLDADCLISSYKPVDTLCDDKSDAGAYYDCRAEERKEQILRFDSHLWSTFL